MNKQKGLAPILIVLLIALGIGGYLIYQKQQTIQVTPTPTSTPESTTSAETANWKTYTSKNGYTLKHPPSFSLKEYDGYALFSDNNMNFTVFNYKAGVDQKILNTEQIEIDGSKAKKYNHILEKYPNQIGFIIVQLSHNEKEFSINVETPNRKPLSKDQIQIVDQILSTFRFD